VCHEYWRGGFAVKEIGDILRRAREEKGISIELLHQRTRIRAGLIEAIEDGRFEEVPSGSVYLKGFLRTLCNELEVDYTQVSELMEPASTTQEPVKREAVRSVRTRQRTRTKPLVIAVAIVLVVALIGIGVYVKFFTDQPDTPTPDSSTQQPLEDPIAEQPDVTDPIESPDETPGEDEPVDVEPVSTVMLVNEQVISDRDKVLTYEVSHWPIELTISIVSEACWVEVYAGDEQLERRTLNPGETREFTSAEPVTLTLGRAPTAGININGIDLGAQTGRVNKYFFLQPSP